MLHVVYCLASFLCHPMYQFLYSSADWITSPIPFSFSKSCPFFRILTHSSSIKCMTFSQAPASTNLCCTWVLIAHTIWSFHVYLALLWCISLLCWCFPVTLLLTFHIHYVFHAFIGCKFLRIDKLCLIIFGVITAPGSRPCTKKQLIKPLLLNFSAL